MQPTCPHCGSVLPGGEPDPPADDRGETGELLLNPPAVLEGGGAPAEAPDPGPPWLQRLGVELVTWVKTLASAGVYATLIVTFVFQVARVDGVSMAPTLQNQDRLIVNKLAYRFHDPQVGDIVMLLYPLDPDKSYVKRIVAREGDLLRIRDGRVFRNDVALDDSFVPPANRGHDDWGPEVVPEGSYFVMGDHRTQSSDSRHWRYVPKKYIVGKVQLCWWPVSHAKLF